MAHHSHEHSEAPVVDPKPNTYSQSALWFSLILIALFVSLVNFVKIVSEDSDGHSAGAATETHAPSGH